MTDNELYRQIVGASVDGLWLVDLDGRTLFANERVAELLGIDSDQLERLRVHDVFETSWSAAEAGAVDVQRVHRRPDGSEIPLLVSERTIRGAGGAVIGRLHQIVDDRRRWALIEGLRRSESQLAEAQSIARLGSWEVRFAGRAGEITWSDAMYDILGLDRCETVPAIDTFAAMIIDRDRPLAEESWARLVAEPGQSRVDVRVRRGDGRIRWIRAVAEVLEHDAAGRPVRFGGTAQDVHELKQAELNLIDAVEVNTLMQVLATAANQATTFDEGLASLRELLLAHYDWARAVAFSVVDGSPVFRPLDPHDTCLPTTYEEAVAVRALAAREKVFEEDWDPGAPMIGFPVELAGEVVAVVVITARSPFERHDMMTTLVDQVAGQLAQVAARDRAAAELAAARDQAMLASAAKSDFLAMMSHEIRTPLNGVIGLNDLLLHSDLDPRQRELAEAMEGAGRALLSLISDILDLSKIESGSLELEDVDFQPAVAVEGVRDLFAADALSRGITLDVEIGADVPRHLRGDPSRFSQILSNLVGNAVKFTHQGRVRVRVDSEPTADGEGAQLCVEVQDTGIGMDPEQQARIFQPFRQGDASTNRTFGGTGLGLAIAQRLTEALGGEINVRSAPGAGSTFCFTSVFRVSTVRFETGESPAPAAHRGHVLVVEDNEINQLVAVGMLEVLGYTSEVAGDGAAAAARVAAGRFDAVLMDLQMPRLDGFGATRLIRSSEAPGVRIPIIALTASATAGEDERCRDAGMTGFLTKPVRLDELGAALAAQLGDEHVVAPERPRGPTSADVLDHSRIEDLAEMGAEAAPLINRAIDNFCRDAAERLADLERRWRADDPSGLRSLAHRLKGSASNLGAQRVAAVALAIEEIAESGDLGPVGLKLVELAAEVDDAVGALAGVRLPEETVRSA